MRVEEKTLKPRLKDLVSKSLAMEHGSWNRDDSFTVMQDFLTVEVPESTQFGHLTMTHSHRSS
jgi:hypothetical protein